MMAPCTVECKYTTSPDLISNNSLLLDLKRGGRKRAGEGSSRACERSVTLMLHHFDKVNAAKFRQTCEDV